MEERRGGHKVSRAVGVSSGIVQVQSSPAAATTRACEVKSGRQRKTEEKIDSNKERERETRTDVDTS